MCLSGPVETGGRRVNCRNNLKQIGLALYGYHDDNRVFPLPANGDPFVSWRVRLLPFLDRIAVYEQYDPTKAWDVEPNAALAMKSMEVYRCPSNPHPQDSSRRYFSDYVMVSGRGTFGGNPSGVKLAEIADGGANTIAVVEAVGLQIVWTEPRDFDVTTQPIGINLKGTGNADSPGILSSHHLRGAHVVFADGSVRFIQQSLDPAVLRKLTTIAGNERIDGRSGGTP